MRQCWSRRALWVVLGTLACAMPAAAISGSDRKAVEAISSLIAKYAQAVSAADSKLASEVWADSSDVSFIHPLGHEHGWEAIKTNVFEKLMGETFSERSLKVKDLQVHTSGNAAWAEFYWDFSAKFRKDGTAIETHGRETQIYRKTGGRWRLVHVHYSGMPVVPGREGF
ncbi:MAG TPA: nuclear transport factor 2 family protein [Vicinamibacterales bacterium]|nr:nuclear transport factor 2 family protein [Vicinamibacterales bacterium]